MTLSTSNGGTVAFVNESMIFRPFDSALVAGVQGTDFAKLYNRIPCQDGSVLDTSRNDALASDAFGRFDTAPWIAPAPVTLTSITVEFPDGVVNEPPAENSCFAYRTTDGVWHGHFEPVPAVHDDAAGVRRVTLQVNAEHVDSIGIVAYTTPVRSVSIVTHPE
jgi:hypothetical protein